MSNAEVEIPLAQEDEEVTDWQEHQNKGNYTHRHIVFTINNYTGDEISKMKSWKKISFGSVGHEVGKKTGTPHLQGYLEFDDSVKLSTIRNKISKKIWIMERRGSAVQATDYTQKEGEFDSWGEMSHQGRRTDRDKLVARVRDGASVYQICDEFPTLFLQWQKGIERMIEVLQVRDCKSDFSLQSCSERIHLDPIDLEYTTTVLVGPPDIGKTQFALSHFDHPLIVSHMDDLKCFDENKYDGIVFDDMDFHMLPRSTQIYLTDWDVTRSIHCRHTCARIPKHTKKIIVGNYYPLMHDPAIKRRVTRVDIPFPISEEY